MIPFQLQFQLSDKFNINVTDELWQDKIHQTTIGLLSFTAVITNTMLNDSVHSRV